MELGVKTRNGLLVQGRPRVFFCAHPSDYARCFDTISEMILKHQNCSIWYWKDPLEEASAEELASLLSEMQMFVVPVTAKFLRTINDGRCRDLQFALDHHIPVLPLAVEEGLAEDFNAICGDLQFLDLTVQDATAISLDERIDSFLRAVLIGDDLAKNVRESFDGYLFLSYRKKDRRFAQQLMHKIHENEQCRDVAIWYDEFLVPGENFNEAISQALRKSDAFALVVTPNLINEPNYVKDHEYPAALDSGKPILAAELVKTDRDILEKDFHRIPPCTNVQDREAFDNDLMNAVSSLSLRQNDDDPLHLYYIGLAYLAGIDVEKNPQRGVELLECAAKAGVADAMQKLVTVYELGDGVPRDWARSLTWRERLADAYQARYEESGREEDGRRLQQVLREWSQALARDYDRKKAIEVIRRLVEAAEHIRIDTGTRESARAVVMSQLELCDLMLREGEAEAASALMQTTGKAALELVKEENGTVYWLDYVTFAVSHTMRARVAQAQGDLRNADFWFGAATELCENAYKESQFPLFLHQLGETSLFYGAMLSNQAENNAKAIDVLTRAVALLEDASKDFEHPVAKGNMVSAYLMLANCEIEEQRYADASAHTRTAIGHLQEMMEASPTAAVRRFLADAYRLMGENPTVDAGERQKYAQAAETAYADVARSAPVLDNVMVIAAKQYEQGFQAIEQDDTARAKDCFRKMMELLAGYPLEQMDHNGALGLVAPACAFSAMILLDEGEPREALLVLKEALPLAERITQKELQMSRDERYCCSLVFLQLGKTYKELGKSKQATELACRAEQTLATYLYDGESETRELDILTDLYELLGELAQEDGNREKAANEYKQFLKYAEEEAKRTPSIENRVEVGVAYAKLAQVQYEAELLEEALPYAEQALAIFQQTYKEQREPFLKDNIDIMKDIIRRCKRKNSKGFLWF